MEGYTNQQRESEKQEAILFFLKQLVEKHKDSLLGTYDYDGIAEEVLSYVLPSNTEEER